MTDGVPTWENFNAGQEFTTTKGATKMAKLNYNKDEAEKSSSNSVIRVPGTWEWAFVDAQMKTSTKGTEGINVTIEVNQDGTLIKAFDTFWLTDNALFRLKDASMSAGKELPEEDTDVIGWTGKAVFSIDDKGYFQMDKYLAKGGEEAKKEGSAFEGASTSDW